MTTLTTTQKLQDAQCQYHALLTGQLARVVVDQNGERVEYTAANKAALANYIDQLQKELNATQVRGPVRVFF